MRNNPFSATGSDLHQLASDIQGKADRYDVDTLRGNVGRLERSLREAYSEIDGLRDGLYRLEARLSEVERRQESAE